MYLSTQTWASSLVLFGLSSGFLFFFILHEAIYLCRNCCNSVFFLEKKSLCNLLWMAITVRVFLWLLSQIYRVAETSTRMLFIMASEYDIPYDENVKRLFKKQLFYVFYPRRYRAFLETDYFFFDN